MAVKASINAGDRKMAYDAKLCQLLIVAAENASCNVRK